MVRFLKRVGKKVFARLKILASGLRGAGKDGSFSPDADPESYKQAAIDYPGFLPPDNRYYLYTKPFDSIKNKKDSAMLFHRFASMLEIIQLPQRAKVLDVACGPGWLSEFLARSGYDVTGVDISPDMIRIANERIRAVQFACRDHEALEAHFIVGDTETADLGSDLYHAAIFFDCLHHFPNPQATLERVFKVLKPGGKLYIQEGVKPPPGSDDEKKLIEEIRRYGTLEKPFSQAELFELLKQAGFVAIQAYEAIQLIVKRKGRAITPHLADAPVPMTNTILAHKPGGSFDSRFANVLKADLRVIGQAPPQAMAAGTDIEIQLSIKNTGDSHWLSKPQPEGGFVSLGTKLLDANHCLLAEVLLRTLLPFDVAPGESVTVLHRFSAPATPGRFWIKLDMVDEQVTWFEDEGSKTIEFPIQVRTPG